MRREEQELLPGFPGGLACNNPAANAEDEGPDPCCEKIRGGPQMLSPRAQNPAPRQDTPSKRGAQAPQRREKLPELSSTGGKPLGSEEDPTLSVPQACRTLWDHMGCSPPDSCVHEILQVRILEWVALPSSRGSSPPRDQTQVSCIAGRFFTI